MQRLIFFLIVIPILTFMFGVTLAVLGIIVMASFLEDIILNRGKMDSSEVYQELLEEILNNLEEAVEEENWDGIDDVVSQIREAIDNPFDNYNTEDW